MQKYLMAHCDIQAEGVPLLLTKNPADFMQRKDTMGLVAKTLFKDVLQPLGSEEVTSTGNEPRSRNVNFFRIRLQIQVTPERHRAWQSKIEELIIARNELVHHSLRRIGQMETVECCQKFIDELEQRGREISAATDFIYSMIENVEAIFPEAVAHFQESLRDKPPSS